MNRLALRLMTKGTLLSGGPAPYATMAGERIFDSRREDWNDFKPEDRGPAIVIRTDNDHREHQRTDYDIIRRTELRIEFAIWEAFREDGSETYVPGWPATDAQLEAMLDLFEYQWNAQLFGSHPWAVGWRQMFVRETYISSPMYLDTDFGRVKMAAREAVMTLALSPDCLPLPRKSSDPAEIAALPALLRAVFDRIAAVAPASAFKTSSAQIRAMLEAQQLPKGYVYPDLAGVRQFWLERRTPPNQAPRVDIEAELYADPPPPP